MLFSLYTKKFSLKSILESAEKDSSPVTFKDEVLLSTGKTIVAHIPDRVIIGPKHPLLVESDLLGQNLEQSLRKSKSRP